MQLGTGKKMSAVTEILDTSPSRNLAAAITWTASKQTYYTVRLLVDRDRRDDAYRAYAYFRWVDDRLDGDGLSAAERAAFVERQGRLIEELYRGGTPEGLQEEERLLATLVQNDHEPDSGLQSYIHHMMAVLAFDAERCGRLISEAELRDYTRWLAVAVTEALHYFIGHHCGAPRCEFRYLAAMGAHVTHMLRDTFEDVEAGYINIPREVIEIAGIRPDDVDSPAYRTWVKRRVELARNYFQAGRAYLERVENPRCRLAGYAYMARFESVLDAIEREGYRLRAAYPECKTLGAALGMAGTMLAGVTFPRLAVALPRRI
jgi:phytoene/squalene synthetase